MEEILNDAAERMRLLTHFDSKTSQLLINEIVEETDVQAKTSKLLHFMLDHISTLRMGNMQNITPNIQCIRSLLSSMDECCHDVPLDITDFISWLPKKIKFYQKQIQTLKSLRDNCSNCKKLEKRLEETQKSLRKHSRKCEKLATALENESDKRASLKDKYQQLKTELEQLKELHDDSSSDGLTETVDHFKSVISSLKQQLSLHQTPDEKDDLIKRLQDENSSLRQTQTADGQLVTVSMYQELLSANGSLNSDKKQLEQRNSVLLAEMRSLRDENQRLHEKLRAKDSIDEKAERSAIEKATLTAKLSDLTNSMTELETELLKTREENASLSKQNIRLEARLARLRDQSSVLTARFGTVDEEALTLQRFGFVLADALCQKFNPANAEDELNRLVAIAKQEHVQLAESTVPLNPYRRHQETGIFKEFEQLEREMSYLQTHPL